MTGSIADATIEVSRLLVEKVDQLGPSIGALLTGEATLPGIDIDSIDRIWPVVVSIGHVMQTRHLWNYIREAMNDEKAAPLRDTRVQPLQIMDISDYEKILALAETGEDLPGMLAHKTRGPFRERDLAVWLHQAPGSPSDNPRLSIVEKRWQEMTKALLRRSSPEMRATIAEQHDEEEGRGN